MFMSVPAQYVVVYVYVCTCVGAVCVYVSNQAEMQASGASLQQVERPRDHERAELVATGRRIGGV